MIISRHPYFSLKEHWRCWTNEVRIDRITKVPNLSPWLWTQDRWLAPERPCFVPSGLLDLILNSNMVQIHFDQPIPNQTQPVLRPRIRMPFGICSTTMWTSWPTPRKELQDTRRFGCGVDTGCKWLYPVLNFNSLYSLIDESVRTCIKLKQKFGYVSK